MADSNKENQMWEFIEHLKRILEYGGNLYDFIDIGCRWMREHWSAEIQENDYLNDLISSLSDDDPVDFDGLISSLTDDDPVN